MLLANKTVLKSTLYFLFTLFTILAYQAITQVSHAKTTAPVEQRINSMVKKLSAQAPQIDRKVLRMAVTAYKNAHQKGQVKKPLLTVIDYSLPSSKKRMWIFDIHNNKVSYYTHVSHGKNSGGLKASSFSNTNGSKQSSLGTFITADTYQGANGYSLNLHGLEKGINDNAYQRRIVMHGAAYANESFIKKNGYLGRSWGCPAVASHLAKPVINKIKGGSVVFAYYPKQTFLAKSAFIRSTQLV
ncbi:MAG: hypothetical protein GKR77_01380 [Legionellales bacterium]|nr:hypothetical protein [Legionellales bacterium]